MKRLIINGDPGIRKGAVIEYDGEEVTCFGLNRNGDYHGPERVQLSCVVGSDDEIDDYQKRNFVPHWLDTEAIAAEDVTVIEEQGELVF